MALRIHPVSASQWAQLAAIRHELDVTEPTIDLTGSDPVTTLDPARTRRAELALIQAYIDALKPKSVASER